MLVFDGADTWQSASELQKRALELQSGICTQVYLQDTGITGWNQQLECTTCCAAVFGVSAECGMH